ncbi:MAG: sulfurtransferase, partial [Betaproteobacteria bacterium CG2_30_59_46]
MQHMTPKQAYEYLQANPEAVFVDVRSEMEYMFVGHPEGSILIPWVDGPDWEIDPNFVGHVKKAASVNRPVVLICRSGRRSVDAAMALEKAGIEDVYNVLNGF